jgi:hypothetical protein
MESFEPRSPPASWRAPRLAMERRDRAHSVTARVARRDDYFSTPGQPGNGPRCFGSASSFVWCASKWLQPYGDTLWIRHLCSSSKKRQAPSWRLAGARVRIRRMWPRSTTIAPGLASRLSSANSTGLLYPRCKAIRRISDGSKKPGSPCPLLETRRCRPPLFCLAFSSNRSSTGRLNVTWRRDSGEFAFRAPL